MHVNPSYNSTIPSSLLCPKNEIPSPFQFGASMVQSMAWAEGTQNESHDFYPLISLQYATRWLHRGNPGETHQTVYNTTHTYCNMQLLLYVVHCLSALLQGLWSVGVIMVGVTWYGNVKPCRYRLQSYRLQSYRLQSYRLQSYRLQNDYNGAIDYRVIDHRVIITELQTIELQTIELQTIELYTTV